VETQKDFFVRKFLNGKIVADLDDGGWKKKCKSEIFEVQAR
jgi:hypothetical protein